MAKPSKPAPTSSPVPADAEEAARILRIAMSEPPAPAISTPPAKSPDERKTQVLKSFFAGLDLETLEEDMEKLRELHTIASRRGDDDTSISLGRVVEVIESLLDTGETCGFSKA